MSNVTKEFVIREIMGSETVVIADGFPDAETAIDWGYESLGIDVQTEPPIGEKFGFFVDCIYHYEGEE